MSDGHQRTAQPSPDSERDLIRVIVSRPGTDEAERACSQLLGAYRERVYLWCYRYVQEHEKALDLAQDVLLGAYRSLGSYEDRRRFGAWLFTVARNRCLSELRRPALLIDEHAEMEDLATPEADPHRALEERMSEEALLGLIARQLDPVERQALWLRCFERMPVDTITTLLRIREKTGARAVLQRARRKLRSALAGQEGKEEGNLS